MTTIPPIPPGPGEPPALTLRQRELYGALVELDSSGKLARMYVGAVMVRRQPGNPDGLALSAHGFRELMEKLSRHLDVPMTEQLSSRLGAMVDRWKQANAAPPDQQQRARGKFIEAAEQLAIWKSEETTSRTKWADTVMDRLEQRPASLPEPIKQLHIKIWNACHRCFEDAGHHRRISEEAFDAHVQRLEDFLLDRLRPRTVADQRAVEDIIREGEANA